MKEHSEETLKKVEYIRKHAGKMSARKMAVILDRSYGYVLNLAAVNGISIKMEKAVRDEYEKDKKKANNIKHINVPCTKNDVEFSELEKFVFCRPWRMDVVKQEKAG